MGKGLVCMEEIDFMHSVLLRSGGFSVFRRVHAVFCFKTGRICSSCLHNDCACFFGNAFILRGNVLSDTRGLEIVLR